MVSNYVAHVMVSNYVAHVMVSNYVAHVIVFIFWLTSKFLIYDHFY